MFLILPVMVSKLKKKNVSGLGNQDRATMSAQWLIVETRGPIQKKIETLFAQSETLNLALRNFQSVEILSFRAYREGPIPIFTLQ